MLAAGTQTAVLNAGMLINQAWGDLEAVLF